VTVSVVVRFKMIDIERDQRDGKLQVLHPSQFIINNDVHTTTISKARNLITQRLITVSEERNKEFTGIVSP
jgi:hypothetical protein